MVAYTVAFRTSDWHAGAVVAQRQTRAMSMRWEHERCNGGRPRSDRSILMSDRFDVCVEDPHELPIRLVFVDELMMQGGVLIGIVSLDGLKNEVQSDIEVAIVHRPRQLLIRCATGEEHGAGVAAQVVAAGVKHFSDCGVRPIVQRKEDTVSQHG